MAEETNVITGAFGEHTEAELLRRQSYCAHDSGWAICEDTRRLSCQLCDADLDPIQVLLQYARREREWKFTRGRLRDQGRKLAHLVKLEKLTKARVRAMSRKDAQAAVDAERERQKNEWIRLGYRLQSIASAAER